MRLKEGMIIENEYGRRRILKIENCNVPCFCSCQGQIKWYYYNNWIGGNIEGSCSRLIKRRVEKGKLGYKLINRKNNIRRLD